MKSQNNLVNLSRSAFKASLILFVIASGIMIYATLEAEPTVNFSEIKAGETIYTHPIYRETGEKFQLYVGLTGDTHSADYEDQYYSDEQSRDLMHIIVYQSLSSDFQSVIVIEEFTSNGIYRQMESLEDAYYRISITNLSDNSISVVSGDANANLGQLLVVGVAVLMLAISISIFSVAFSLTVTGIVLFGIVYPIYKVVQMDQERQRQQKRKVYYPPGYTSQENTRGPVNNQSTQ